MAQQDRGFGVESPATNQRFHGGGGAILRARKRECVAAVAVSRQVERVRAETVAGKIFGEIHHESAIGGKPVQQNDAPGWLNVSRWIKDRHRRVAAACIQPDPLLKKFRY